MTIIQAKNELFICMAALVRNEEITESAKMRLTRLVNDLIEAVDYETNPVKILTDNDFSPEMASMFAVICSMAETVGLKVHFSRIQKPQDNEGA